MALEWLFGDSSSRFIKSIEPLVATINGLEGYYKNIDNSKFAELVVEWKRAIAQGTKLDSLLPDVFAAVREAAIRTLGKRLFDVQLMGGIILHKGMIAEMKTGEGKTLVVVAPTILNALKGPVHVVTINDYLVKRDCNTMKPIYNLFGLTVDYVLDSSSSAEQREAYKKDITYCPNVRLIFGFLESTTAASEEDKIIQANRMHCAFIDEIDSILIDEARTPCIIADHAKDATIFYKQINPIISQLQLGLHYILDPLNKNAYLNTEGTHFVQNFLLENNLITGKLCDLENLHVYHVTTNLLKAHKAMHRNKDYVVKENVVIIIDEYRGRLAFGRRYSEGVHQAIEAKEGVEIKRENRTKASITQTNFFRMYLKLGGMTGTASTEADEFTEVYGLKVVRVPTNREVIRLDNDWSYFPPKLVDVKSTPKDSMEVVALVEKDKKYYNLGNWSYNSLIHWLNLNSDKQVLIYAKYPELLYKAKNAQVMALEHKINSNVKTAQQKIIFEIHENTTLGDGIRLYRKRVHLYEDVLQFVQQRHSKGQPILLCCNSVGESEVWSNLLQVPHALLNATNHEREANIIAQAGRPGAVVVSTAMSGRGTDILLGGNAEMIAKQLAEERALNEEELHEIILKEVIADKALVRGEGGLLVLVVAAPDSEKAWLQLIGRSGRQGDEGRSYLFISLEDELFKNISEDPLMSMLLESYFPKDERFTCSKQAWDLLVELQRNQQSNYFESRKQLLQYDDIINKQRQNIYYFRDYLLNTPNLNNCIKQIAKISLEENKIESLAAQLDLPIENFESIFFEKLEEILKNMDDESTLKQILLENFDELWQEKIIELENLKKTSNLATYEQKDPIQEYKDSAYEVFKDFLELFRKAVIDYLFKQETEEEEKDWLDGMDIFSQFTENFSKTFGSEFFKNPFSKLMENITNENAEDSDEHINNNNDNNKIRTLDQSKHKVFDKIEVNNIKHTSKATKKTKEKSYFANSKKQLKNNKANNKPKEKITPKLANPTNKFSRGKKSIIASRAFSTKPPSFAYKKRKRTIRNIHKPKSK